MVAYLLAQNVRFSLAAGNYFYTVNINFTACEIKIELAWWELVVVIADVLTEFHCYLNNNFFVQIMASFRH